VSFAEHLNFPRHRGPIAGGAVIGSAGGAPCGDLVRISLRSQDGRIAGVTFDADGCGAMHAAASACCSLADGVSLLEAAAIGPHDVATELGGLSPGKFHAADLAADALHRALSELVSAEGEPLLADRSCRVLVAMSGGVDSAAAAMLEQRAGREVVAVTLKLWADQETDGERSCCSPQAVLGARALAHSMGLPHFTLDLRSEFRAAVVDHYISEHDRGRTPNPCVRCNGEVRFDAMLALAERLGAEALATGHYARIEHDTEGPLLSRAADPGKDQTYMLSALPPAALGRVRFPLGDLVKDEVREIARAAGLPVADKRESQDLCFLAGTSRDRFLARHGGLHDSPGDVVDRSGRVLGSHPGHRRYTVGQRRGLGVAAGEPLFVLGTDAAANRVVVGPREALAARAVVLRDVTLNRDGERVDGVKLRYRSEPLPCRVAARPGHHDTLTAALAEQALGVAPGQSACLMDGDLVVGHGTIAAAA
jgi:tRNA-uridine 2-sulfurtransferase